MTTADQVAVQPEYLPLARALYDLLPTRANEQSGRVVVAVGGESGSGKTVTAACLAAVAEENGRAPVILHQDDYFVRPPRTNHEHRCTDLSSVGPHEVRLELLQQHVDRFRSGARQITAPLVDYAANRFVTQRIDFDGRRVLIVEGTYVLGLSGVDLGIFLAATHDETRDRRRVRNRDIDAPVIDEILRIEHGIIAPMKAKADVVIDPEFRIVRRSVD